MSRSISSLLVTIGTIGLTPVLWATIAMVVEHQRPWGWGTEWTVPTFVTVGVALLALHLIWRKGVSWTRKRAELTAAALPLAAVPAVVVVVLVTSLEDVDLAIVFGGITLVASWLILVAFVWRESSGERERRISTTFVCGRVPLACPRCDYDMRGLNQARCPECGTEYTLDGLFAQLITEDPEEARASSRAV